MKGKLFINLFILSLIIFPGLCKSQTLTYVPGGGLHLNSAKNDWQFLFTGYLNNIYSFHNVDQNNSVQSSFYVHRARTDFAFDYLNDYEIFFEFDAAGQRTQMVLAQLQAKLFADNKILIGKFINPFSPENNRSTSGLSTIERYSGLNSMFLLPALDTQFGIMFFGSASNLNYYLSVTNGNG